MSPLCKYIPVNNSREFVLPEIIAVSHNFKTEETKILSRILIFGFTNDKKVV